MSHASFQVTYDGPALDGSTIDVRELAPALLAFGEVIEQANFTLNEGRTEVTLRVNASFKSGCFGIDFAVVQGLAKQMLALFNSETVLTAKQLIENLGFWGSVGAGAGLGAYKAGKGLIGFLKWLRNRKIKEVTLLEDGRYRITVDKESLEVEKETIALYRNYKLRKALDDAITKSLEREGFDSVAFSGDPEAGFVTVSKDERAYFAAPPPGVEEIADTEAEASLQIVNVSFKDDNKWRFFDGTASFYAAILDDTFLNRVLTGEETFASGDILKVILHTRQWVEAEVLKSEHQIMRVLQHRRGATQLPLVLSTPEDPRT